MGPGYRSELDGLRGLAVLAVVLFHSDARWFAGGQQGVDVFFVLSGYLITNLLRHRPEGFWRRRFMRLFPALAALGLAYLAMAGALGWPRSEVIAAVTYTRNIPLMLGQPAGPLLHTWSLAIEWQFYLLWPLVLPFLTRNRLVALWLAVTLGRLAFLLLTGDETAAYYSPLWHSSGLLLGAAIAMTPALPAKWSFVGLGLLGLHCIAAPLGYPRLSLGLPLVEIATALLIAAPSRIHAALSCKPLVGLGLISYGVYLWHFPAAAYFQAEPWHIQLAASVMVGLPMGLLSYATVEKLRRLPAPAAA